MKKPDYSAPAADDIAAMAKAAGLPVDPDVALRIATSMDPALKGFSPISGTLPFDLEPASFVVIQNGAGK
jgi:hypothetical protein